MSNRSFGSIISKGPERPVQEHDDSAVHVTHSGSLSPLSASLWKNSKQGKHGKTDCAAVPDVLARITWKDLWVTVTTPAGKTNTILQGVTGFAEPGYIMAIMGPSGSGKSTLLDSLAGRLAGNCTQTGDILINGRRRTLAYGSAAYVTQEDDLIGTLTVRESLSYSACLRLPTSMPRAEKMAIVQTTIEEMGLQDCANTPVGNWHLRGLSGGEKRRLSISLEILTRPRILFLDEPTSGLDSAAAFFVMSTLQNLAKDGRTVVSSIHQPSSEVFDLFDYLCLLSYGQTVYFGEAYTAHEFFASAGFPCPTLRSPSDHFLRAVNADFDRVKRSMKGLSFSKTRREDDNDRLETMSTPEVVNILVEAYQNSEYCVETKARVHEISQVKGMVLHSQGSLASFWMQAWTLTQRSFVNMSRDIGYYWLRLAIYVALSLCIGTIFYKLGYSFDAILSRSGCMSFVAGFLTFMSIGGFPCFVEDMKVFTRERLNGHYGVAAFVVGNSLSSFPYLMLIAAVSSSIVYWMVGLHPGLDHFLFYMLGLLASVACVESLMMAVASLVPNYLMGIITGAGIQGIYMLLAGFFRLAGDVPKPFWRYPMSYLSFHMYALQGIYMNEFLGSKFENLKIDGVLLGPPIPGEYIIAKQYQIDINRSKWWDITIIYGMCIGYRIIFFFCIKVKEDVYPFMRVLLARYHVRGWRAAFSGSASSHCNQQKSSSLAQMAVRPLESPSPVHDHLPLQKHKFFWTATPSPQNNRSAPQPQTETVKGKQ